MNQILAGRYATAMSQHHHNPHAPNFNDFSSSSVSNPAVFAAQSPVPQNVGSAYGALQPQQQQQQPRSMAAPPLALPQTTQTQTPSSNTAGSSPGVPQSPNTQSREQERVALLLDINVDLLQEVHRLQAEGKGGATSPQQQLQLKQQGQPDKLASDEYIQCLRRIQANLGYLMPKARDDPQKTPQGPMYMSPPPHMSHLRPKYEQLSSLFPGWSGIDPRTGQAAGSPGTNSMNGMMASPGSTGQM